MAAPRRWFRLDVGWSDSEWLAALEPAARLAWVELLGYVKSTGLAGAAKAVPAVVFGRNRGIPADAVQAMLDAATDHGALEIVDKSWTVVNWADYQEPDPTAAERMRRHRAERSRLSTTPQNRVTTDNNGRKPVTRDTCNAPVTGGVTRRVTETETETYRRTDASSTNSAQGAVDTFCADDPDDDPPTPATETIYQHFMPLLRELDYAADDHDGSILKALERKGVAWDAIENVVRGLALMRQAGELSRPLHIPPGGKLSLKILYTSRPGKFEAQPWWNRAEQAYWKHQELSTRGLKRLAI